jgi:hypothetical protein
VVTAVAALDADVAGRLGPVVDDGVRRSRAMLEEVAAGSWASLDDCSRQVTEIVGLLLQLISGALVRAVDLDDGMCRIADRLLAEVSAAAVQPLWGALTIPSHAELFDLRDGCIRVGWGNRQLWGVPLVLHELGHAAGARVSRLTEVNGRLTVEHPLLERANAIGEGLDVKYLHLQEHWADIFAVFVGGLAPLAAMASLVFPPSRADRATGTHPSPARRVAAMAEALRRLHPRDQQVELALRWLDATWRRIVADATIVEPGPDVVTIVEQCVDDLQTTVPGGAPARRRASISSARARRRWSTGGPCCSISRQRHARCSASTSTWCGERRCAAWRWTASCAASPISSCARCRPPTGGR